MKEYKDYLKSCTMCPRMCRVNRHEKVGFCKAGEKIKVAHICLHKFEEPCISIGKGSGTIFFSGCNLRCVFCQNYKISANDYGLNLTIEELSKEMLKLQDMGAENINLVSPTIYSLSIREAIIIAKENGLKIPVIYNTNGYENVEVLKEMEDVIDIYLPDFKYSFDELAVKYSNSPNYTNICLNAIEEILRQKKENIYDENGKMLSGVIIRHLVLPNHILNTKRCLRILKERFGEKITISIMFQYFPTYNSYKYPKINRKINKIEQREVLDYLEMLNFSNGYVQEMPENEESYVPIFDISTLK